MISFKLRCQIYVCCSDITALDTVESGKGQGIKPGEGLNIVVALHRATGIRDGEQWGKGVGQGEGALAMAEPARCDLRPSSGVEDATYDGILVLETHFRPKLEPSFEGTAGDGNENPVGIFYKNHVGTLEFSPKTISSNRSRPVGHCRSRLNHQTDLLKSPPIRLNASH